jgi:2-phospho-L-lactate guanylyltransferase
VARSVSVPERIGTMSHTFALIVPVKALARAKSRLTVAGGRESLMRAFALDAIAAASRSPAVARVHVVTDDQAFDVAGVHRLPDEGDGDLNRALHHAALRVRLDDPDRAVAAMCADLPSLRTDDLTDALAAGLAPRWFVADADGTGTTLLAAGPGTDLDPHFGTGSARRHEESGAVPIRAELSTLRRDVDTELDLDAARALGVGEHTAAALRDLADAGSPHPLPRPS